MCKKIHRGGNAEQYHADKKYKEAVAVAVEACAEDVASPSTNEQLSAGFELRLPTRVAGTALADQSAGRQHDQRPSRMARRRFNSLPLRDASDVLLEPLPALMIDEAVASITTGEEGIQGGQ